MNTIPATFLMTFAVIFIFLGINILTFHFSSLYNFFGGVIIVLGGCTLLIYAILAIAKLIKELP